MVEANITAAADLAQEAMHRYTMAAVSLRAMSWQRPAAEQGGGQADGAV